MTTDSSELDERLGQLGVHLDEERRIRRSEAMSPSPGASATRRTDVAGPAPDGPGSGRRRSLTPWVLSAAAVIVIAIGGLSVSLWPDEAPTALEASTENEASNKDNEPDAEPAPPGSSAPVDDADRDPVDGPSLSGFMATLVTGIDPVGGPLVFVGEVGQGPSRVAADYLSERMPDLSVDVVEVETNTADRLLESGDPLVTLTLVRWSYPRPDGEAAGSVVVRADQQRIGVVAATTDGVQVEEIERLLDRLRVVVNESGDDLLVADVTTLDGEVVAGAPFPDGLEAAGQPAIGTAGTTETDRLEITMEVEPIPVVVRLQHLGGTWLTVTEFGVDAVGFEASCGANPPVAIDVGEWLEPLQDGPAPRSRRPVLVNQGVWHHRGEQASIEIRWPADPDMTARLSGDSLPEGEMSQFGPPPLSGGYDPSSAEEATTHQLASVDSSTTDPCAIVQISTLGQAAVVDWWSTAISGQWSFGLPLSIAELDPLAGPLGLDPDQADADADDELVVDSVVVAERPVVAATGSCDGLPDDPPREGRVSGSAALSGPAAALAVFVAEPVGDPPLPDGGYTELASNGDVIGYVHGPIDDPAVVIEVERSGEVWTVVGWSAAPC